MDLKAVPTSELVDEIAKREGVEEITVPEDKRWYLKVWTDDGKKGEYGKEYGPARILVVID